MKKNLLVSAQLIGLLILGFGLSGCNTTSNQTGLNVRGNASLDAEYQRSKRDRAIETALIAKLRVNSKDLNTVFELAKLRDSTGNHRLARLGYRQVVKASVEANDQNEAMKTYAASRLAILRSDRAGASTVPTMAYRF